MKVAILTMFNGLTTTYSLVNVVADHLHMLLEHGIEVKLLVSEHCPDTDRYGIYLDPRIEWVKITNYLHNQFIRWYDYNDASGSLHPTFYEEADILSKDFILALQDVDVCMMHDILYQGWHYVHNIAIRKAQPLLPHTKFLSFTHSLPVSHPTTIDPEFQGRYTGMPNTKFIYPTASGLPALASQYNIPESDCHVVYNTVPLLASMSPAVYTLHQQTNLLTPDILIIYPARFSSGKKCDKVASLAGGIASSTNLNVKVVFCDFPCTDTDPALYKKQILEAATYHGLPLENVVFTSDYGFPQGFPRQGVFDLFTLSNLFICPSLSESFGLTVLEAASRGNFIVLNEAVPALMELATTLDAYHMRWDARNFGYNTHETYHPSEKDYYFEHGRIITELMAKDRVLFAKTTTRTHYSYDWIWKNQLAPLIY